MIESIQRNIRLGLIGGGPGSYIGETHRMSARLDGLYDIVASALASDPLRSVQAGKDLGIAADRSYGSWQQLIEAEAKRPDRVDALAIMTPNDSHFDICMAALDAGFHVICDKPLTNDLASSKKIAEKVKATGKEFCVTYCYTGYPMVRQARDMVLAGELGEIRQLHVQYVQGHLAHPEASAGWRMETRRGGSSLVLLDIGPHAFHMGAFVSGLDVKRLCADAGSAIPGREIDDYVATLMHLENGARGSMWVTNSAAGSEHGLSFRIHGDKGGLEWHQETPNRLIHRRRDDFEQIITRRLGSKMSEGAQLATRIDIGHPEGYIEAFANLYAEFAHVVAQRIANPEKEAPRYRFPDVIDGVKGLAVVEAAIKSSQSGKWEDVPQI